MRRLRDFASALGCALSLMAAPAAARPAIWMFPPPSENGQALRALFQDPAAWQQTRARIDGLGYADHWLNSQFSDAELRAWLPLIGKWHLKFGLEVGALKMWGPTADEAFARDAPKWDRFVADGAHLDSIAMDEPFAFVRRRLQQTMQYAADQTARFVYRVRQRYPGAAVGDIEPYPGIPADDLLGFLDLVQQRLRGWQVRGLDFFRADVDWMHFRPGDPAGAAGWQGVRDLQSRLHQRGIPFSLVYWAADFPSQQRAGLATEQTWQDGVMREGAAYAAVGGAPDEAVIESWLDSPNPALPETNPGSFTRSVFDFTSEFAPGSGSGR
jgi:hypothetical protein